MCAFLKPCSAIRVHVENGDVRVEEIPPKMHSAADPKTSEWGGLLQAIYFIGLAEGNYVLISGLKSKIRQIDASYFLIGLLECGCHSNRNCSHSWDTKKVRSIFFKTMESKFLELEMALQFPDSFLYLRPSSLQLKNFKECPYKVTEPQGKPMVSLMH